MPAVARLAKYDTHLPVELDGDGLGVGAPIEIGRLELRPPLLEGGDVVLGGPLRLALRQKIVARVAVLDADDVAHLAKLLDALQ